MFLDGRRIGLGPERGNRENWFFETYDLPLAAGDHRLVARVTALGDIAPFAQISVAHGFLLAADNNHGNASRLFTMPLSTRPHVCLVERSNLK
ncbi:MAG: hypothetical protein WC003_13095 [Terrimicrobiaceae bacterium]